MPNERYAEIDEVIDFIHKHIYDPLPLSRLASHISYSPYHFTRIFKEKTGLSPLYYVSSHRLQKAKELLLSTNLSIRDIGLEIGQQSLGTFTTRFTERVGVTPSAFRNSAQQADGLIHTLRMLDDWAMPSPASARGIRVEGTVQASVRFEGIVLIGLFAKPIPEGLPLYGTLLSSMGYFSFTDVKPGTYYLLATSVPWGTQAKEILLPNATLRTRTRKPVVVKPGSAVPYQHVTLHPPGPGNPPILISLPLLMNLFLSGTRQLSNR